MRRILSLFVMVSLFVGVAAVRAQESSAKSVASPTPKLRFFLKLVPPRPTFANDMTPDEAKLMQQHADYWKAQFATGAVLIIGPVLDAKGAFGMAVLETATEDEARTLAMNDPSVKAGLNKVELSPMRLFLMKK
jgi:uncharacterized protein YciI